MKNIPPNFVCNEIKQWFTIVGNYEFSHDGQSHTRFKKPNELVLHVSVNIVFMLAYKIYNKFQSD